MSAIVGRIDFSGKHVEAEPFAASLSALAPYGVDGSAVIAGDNFRIGIQRLNLSNHAHSTLDPVRSDNTTLVADAIINNREDLGAALGYGPADLANFTDVMLLQHSFSKWGRACPRQILGDYSFAVYDQDQRRLFLTRDHIGTRPLYWSKRDDTAIFATDIRAILANTDFDWPVDTREVARHVMGPQRPQINTFFRHINKLPPATGLIIDGSDISENEWWTPHDIPEFKHANPEDYVEHFRVLMTQLGREYANTSGPIGVHISGGIDSCSVAAFAAMALKSQGRNLKAGYTWAPPVSDQYPIMSKRDERHNIQNLSQTLDVPVRYGKANGQTQRESLDLEIELNGIADLSDEVPVLKEAKADGLRVMLSGWGGDEAYSAHGIGYLSYVVKRLDFREARKVLNYYVASRRFRPRKAARAFIQWGVSPMFPDILYRRFSPFVNLFEGGAFPSSEVLTQAPAPAPYIGEDVRLISDPRTYLANILRMGHLNMRMETWAAWSSKFEFQYRYPLLDRRLLEFVLGMPRDIFFADGSSRYLARMVTQGLVPEGLTKHDQANEILRDANHLTCWHLLLQDLASGMFSENSAWLDMEKLREAISSVPENMGSDELQVLAKMLGAVRIWKMEQRLNSR